MATVHLPIRQLVEFLLRTGSIDSRFTGFDRALEGAHIHRKLQKAAGDGYQAEVFLSVERQAEDITFTLEGRADGIFTDETGTVVIDEIKTTAVPPEEITEDMNPCHWAQGMVYGAIYAAQQSLPELNVRLTYYQIDTDQIIRFIRRFTQQELDEFLDKLLCQYAPWAQRRIEWDVKRTQSLAALQFPFAQYRPGQRAMAGEIYLPRWQDRRLQGRYAAVLSGSYRHWQDHERAFPRAESHGRRQRRKAVLSHGPQHDPDCRRGCLDPAAYGPARACSAQCDADRQGKGLPASGRRGTSRLPAGALSLRQRLLRPHQGCADSSAGRYRQL